MKSLIKNILITILTSACFINIAHAQITALPDAIVVKKEMNFPPLSVLIDSAIKHNAMVKFRKVEIDAKKSYLTTQKNSWLKNFGIQGDSRYGNIDAFSTNTNGVSTGGGIPPLSATPTSGSDKATSTRQINYAAGVYLKIPVFDVVNRKSQIKQAKAELEQAKYMELAQEDDLRQVVIRQYQDLLLKQKLLGIKSENLGSATVNMEMVEKEFRNGVLPVMEYVRIADMTSRIQADYELAKSEFLVSKQILEEIVGFVFK